MGFPFGKWSTFIGGIFRICVKISSGIGILDGFPIETWGFNRNSPLEPLEPIFGMNESTERRFPLEIARFVGDELVPFWWCDYDFELNKNMGLSPQHPNHMNHMNPYDTTIYPYLFPRPSTQTWRPFRRWNFPSWWNLWARLGILKKNSTGNPVRNGKRKPHGVFFQKGCLRLAKYIEVAATWKMADSQFPVEVKNCGESHV